MAEARIHYCARLEPTLSPEEKVTFPMYKKVQKLTKDGDPIEEFVELSEDEKKNLRASCPYVDVGNSKESSPLTRDVFEVFDEMESLYNSVPESEWDEFKKSFNQSKSE